MTVHATIDISSDLLTLHVTPAEVQDRDQVERLAAVGQDVTSQTVELAYIDQGDTGDVPAQAAAEQGIHLEVVKLTEAKRGVVVLSRRWVVERSFAWTMRFRRQAKDDERLPETVERLSFLAVACLMLCQLFVLAAQSPHHALAKRAPGRPRAACARCLLLGQ